MSYNDWLNQNAMIGRFQHVSISSISEYMSATYIFNIYIYNTQILVQIHFHVLISTSALLIFNFARKFLETKGDALEPTSTAPVNKNKAGWPDGCHVPCVFLLMNIKKWAG